MRSKAIRGIEAVLGGGAAFCLVALMLLVMADVVGRDVLNKPVPGSTELAEIVLAAMVFLGYPLLALGEGHITVDLIHVGPGMRRLQRILAALVGMTVFGLISWCVGVQAMRVAGYGDSSAVLGIPMALVLGSMSLLAALTVAGCLAVLIDALLHDSVTEPDLAAEGI